MAFQLHAGYLPGCIGRVVHLHGDYYSRHFGFGAFFEAQVARELGAFVDGFVERRDGLWLALSDGVVHGSIAIQGEHGHGDGAHLRWFIVSDALRGTGAGNALLDAAVSFCRDCGYPRTLLRTFEGLTAARHLYEKAGFRLVQQQPGEHWGARVNEQRFELLT